MTDYFITGTDTGVGKTYVCCSLLRGLRARGLRAMGFKPVCCGDRAEARAMRDACGEATLSLERINPCYLRAHAEPLIAAALQREAVEPEKLLSACHALREEGYGPILVEGCGGWETPLAPGCTMADLAASLGLPVLLVVDNRLGAANHAAMTVRSIQAHGLRCAGIILNHPGEEWDSAAVTNARLLEECTGIPVLAELIQGDECEPELLAVPPSA